MFSVRSRRLVFVAALALIASAGTVAAASAQESPAPPAPAGTPQPTLLDRQYDGHTHVMVAPYVWAPTINADFQFSLPATPRRRVGGIAQTSVLVGPSTYLPKLNTAGMMAFDVRHGDVDLFGDAIYLNASTTATIASNITLPRRTIPVTVNASARIATAIWEAALGFTLARGHDADLSMLVGVREFPINLNVGYNATIGKRGLIAPSGTVTASDNTDDIIWGIRGRAFFGDQHWYVPYYFDVGTGSNNQTLQAYGGAGYAFPHGQTLVALYRSLNYYSFPPDAHTQRLNLAGPLLGYTFNL